MRFRQKELYFNTKTKSSKQHFLRNSSSQDNIRHMINIQQYKKIKDKSIQEENRLIFKRLQENEPVLNVNKLEDGYKNHLKFKKLLKKVDSFSNKLYVEPYLPPLKTKVIIM